MAEPLEIAAAADDAADQARRASSDGTLAGKKILVTSGPTHEPIDPVRYIANRSSGKQGHAIAAAAAAAGAEVVLICGPVNIADPAGVTTVRVETAREMLAAVEQALPVDGAVFAAAVADWRVAEAGRQKIKKQKGATPALTLMENPDILATIAHRKSKRPRLVIGFAAETENVIENAQAKLARKGCDWIVANDVSAATGIMGGDSNRVHLITSDGVESWPPQSKDAVRGHAGGPHRRRARRGRAMSESPHRARGDAAPARRRSAASRLSERGCGRPRSHGRGRGRCAGRASRPAGAPSIPTGLAVALPAGTEGQVRPRSGLAARHGVTVLNAPGTIDADYRGEIQVILVNFGQDSFTVTRGMRIAQLIIAPVSAGHNPRDGRILMKPHAELGVLVLRAMENE